MSGKWLNQKNLIILVAIIILITLSSVVFVEKHKTEIYNEKIAYESLNKLYQDQKKEIPKLTITQKNLHSLSKKINKVKNKQKQKDLTIKLESLQDFYDLKKTIDDCFDNDVLKSSVTLKQINIITKNSDKLPKKISALFKDKISIIRTQYDNIQKLESCIAGLFEDKEKTIVKKDLSRDEYNEALKYLSNVLQKDIVEKANNSLKLVNTELERKEEEERQRIQEEKRRQEEERKKQIAAAWIKFNIPYVSQNLNGVMNGCEIASLLMGLKYKGYLQNMDLITYANMVPKSTDPYQGFVNDIFSLEPRSILHWIAPNALASFGRSSSQGANVVDISGASLTDLDNEIINGNPVVIYLTGNLNTPQAWIDGGPKNMHVLLLSGYNTITKEQYIVDPWTRSSYTWTVSKAKVESIYNAVGKRAVVIR